MTTHKWQDAAARKQQQQREAIAAAKALLKISEESLEAEKITCIGDTATLASKIARGELSSEAVVGAYIESLTEILFNDAISRAKELDDHLRKEGKPVGPLHGVPFTLKDQFNVKGYDTTLGYTGRAFQPATEDAVLIQMLQSLGAVAVAKTNLPQSIMWCETENPLWGLTTNPMNREYTPGGSTGGESALLYLNGSILGWGTDIGGSIRIPCQMMGLYGLKPSSSRLPYTGVPVSTEGQEHVHSSIGPLARTLSSVHQVMREIILAEPWKKDCRCAPIPWRADVYEEILSRKLTIGILLDDGVVRPHPAITRVIQAAASALKVDGHELVDWNADLHPECIEVMDSYYSADGGEDIRREVQAGGDPFIPHVERLINRGEAISVYEYWQLNKRKRSLQQRYLEKWNSIKSPSSGKPVDVLLMPVMPHPAVPHKGCRWVGYTKVWNFLDYTALAMPGGKIEAQDSEARWDYPARNEMDEWNAKLWKENKSDMVEMQLPVGVQIVGRGLEEEKVLAVAKILDGLLHKSHV